jgi:hypothetical protein
MCRWEEIDRLTSTREKFFRWSRSKLKRFGRWEGKVDAANWKKAET